MKVTFAYYVISIIIMMIISETAILVLGFSNDNLKYEIKEFKQQAIEYGYAQYNPITGKWEWVENE